MIDSIKPIIRKVEIVISLNDVELKTIKNDGGFIMRSEALGVNYEIIVRYEKRAD